MKTQISSKKFKSYVQGYRNELILSSIVLFLIIIVSLAMFYQIRSEKEKDIIDPQTENNVQNESNIEDDLIVKEVNYVSYIDEKINISFLVSDKWDIDIVSEDNPPVRNILYENGDPLVTYYVDPGNYTTCEKLSLSDDGQHLFNDTGFEYTSEKEVLVVNEVDEELILCKSDGKVYNYILKINNPLLNEWGGVVFRGTSETEKNDLIDLLESIEYEEDDQYKQEETESPDNPSESEEIGMIESIIIKDVYVLPRLHTGEQAEKYINQTKVGISETVGYMYVDMDVVCKGVSKCTDDVINQNWVQYYGVDRYGERKEIEEMPLLSVQAGDKKISYLASIDSRGAVFNETNSIDDWVDIYIYLDGIIDEKLTRVYYSPYISDSEGINGMNYVNVRTTRSSDLGTLNTEIPKFKLKFKDENGKILFEGETNKYGHLIFKYDYIGDEGEYHNLFVEVESLSDTTGFNTSYNGLTEVSDTIYEMSNRNGRVKNISFYVYN